MPRRRSNLVWVDLETTGLSVGNRAILEIASVVTDKDLNVVGEGPVLVVHQPDDILERIDPWSEQQRGAADAHVHPQTHTPGRGPALRQLDPARSPVPHALHARVERASESSKHRRQCHQRAGRPVVPWCGRHLRQGCPASRGGRHPGIDRGIAPLPPPDLQGMTVDRVYRESERTGKGKKMKRARCRSALACPPGLGLPLCVFEPVAGFELVSSP